MHIWTPGWCCDGIIIVEVGWQEDMAGRYNN